MNERMNERTNERMNENLHVRDKIRLLPRRRWRGRRGVTDDAVGGRRHRGIDRI